MKRISNYLLIAGVSLATQLSAQQLVAGKKTAADDARFINQSTTSNPPRDLTKADRKDKLREALLPLLRGVFNTHWEKLDVLLTIDAGWRNDSLSIEYKYYKGTNVLALNEEMLMEKIYFTVKPEEVDELDTENDEFLFLYLRNTKKKLNVHQLISRPGTNGQELNWRSSMGIPVRAENLPMIIHYLKELRSSE